MDFIVEAPVNSLSFGNVSYNILREFWKQDLNVTWFPLSKNADFSSFDKVEEEFVEWLKSSHSESYKNIKKDMPTLKIWHINGSHQRISKNQLLYSFYELDKPTQDEINLAKFQDHVSFSSSYASNIFNEFGVKSTSVPLGFDEDFFKTDKKYLDEDVIHFGLMGKFEKRKHTEKIVKLWLEKYGNNRKYQLTLCVTNPFYKKEDMETIFVSLLNGTRYNNVNILSYLQTNSEVNELMNAIDIDLTGLSGAEGWNLPAFNSTCLGKWSIVLNATGHKDWANSKNSILIEPNGKEEVYDNKFFVEGSKFNQGEIYTWDRDNVSQAMDDACDKKGTLNKEGQKLKSKFSYKNTANSLVSQLKKLA